MDDWTMKHILAPVRRGGTPADDQRLCRARTPGACDDSRIDRKMPVRFVLRRVSRPSIGPCWRAAGDRPCGMFRSQRRNFGTGGAEKARRRGDVVGGWRSEDTQSRTGGAERGDRRRDRLDGRHVSQGHGIGTRACRWAQSAPCVAVRRHRVRRRGERSSRARGARQWWWLRPGTADGRRRTGRPRTLDRAVPLRLLALDLPRGRHVRRTGARVRVPAGSPGDRPRGGRGAVTRWPVGLVVRCAPSRARDVAHADLGGRRVIDRREPAAGEPARRRADLDLSAGLPILGDHDGLPATVPGRHGCQPRCHRSSHPGAATARRSGHRVDEPSLAPSRRCALRQSGGHAQ